LSHVDRREVEEYSHRQVYPVRRTRDAGSKRRHQSAVGRVGEQTPEKCVQSQECEKEHTYLLALLYFGVNKLFRNSWRVMGGGMGKLFELFKIICMKSTMFSLGLRPLKRAL